MTAAVMLSATAEHDLTDLLASMLERAHGAAQLDRAEAALASLDRALLQQLGASPYSFPKAGARPTRRELLIPADNGGFVALYEIASPGQVVVLAVRPAVEEDYQ